MHSAPDCKLIESNLFKLKEFTIASKFIKTFPITSLLTWVSKQRNQMSRGENLSFAFRRYPKPIMNCFTFCEFSQSLFITSIFNLERDISFRFLLALFAGADTWKISYHMLAISLSHGCEKIVHFHSACGVVVVETLTYLPEMWIAIE